MHTYHCLIVDDEPIAREIIQAYCSKLDMLQVVALCSNALEARTVLQKHKIDILFLDINMPVLDGVAFLKTVKNGPQVIFTTAYKEYALEAFNLSACDYLLKPFSLERFIMAIDKALEKLNAMPLANQVTAGQKTDNFIFIKYEGKIFKILYEHLLYAEAQGNNTKIVTIESVLLPAMTFSSLEELLPKKEFLRVHRSFIINKAKINHIEGNRIFIERNEIPVGNNYREEFLKKIGL